jgi:hypothetical protein
MREKPILEFRCSPFFDAYSIYMPLRTQKFISYDAKFWNTAKISNHTKMTIRCRNFFPKIYENSGNFRQNSKSVIFNVYFTLLSTYCGKCL